VIHKSSTSSAQISALPQHNSSVATMRRIIIVISALVLLIIPATAMARTPVSGGLKQTIAKAALR